MPLVSSSQARTGRLRHASSQRRGNQAIDTRLKRTSPSPDPPRADVTRNGRGTTQHVLEASLCPALAVHRIARVGIEHATPGFQRVRVRPSGSFIMAVCEGSGRILLDGAWHTIRAGTACMAPPRILNAFEARDESKWVIAWVRYDEPPPVHPLVGAASPQKVKFPAETLHRAISGLMDEWQGPRDSRLVHHWVELIHGLARRIAQPARVDEKLARLWEDISENLSHPWTLPLLARRFHSSREHLRRLCLGQLGRSPMQHLTYMRMQRTRQILEDRTDKLDTIAAEVGYESGLALARAFRRWVGCSPTEYRRG